MAQVGRWRARAAARVAVAAMLTLAGMVGSTAVAASATPVTIVVNPTSGPPGLSVAISGAGYAAGTTYGLCILPAGKTKCGYEGANLIGGAPAEQFTAAADGTIPAGTSGIIPDLIAGPYRIVSTAPGTGAVVAGADFTVTAPQLKVTPDAAPAGTNATVTITGGAPNTKYTVCVTQQGSPGCGGTGIALADLQTDATGALPGGTTVRLPGLTPATYAIGVYLSGANNIFLASGPLQETAPTIGLSASSGPAGTVVTVTGTGYAPGGTYQFCLAPAGGASCGGIAINLTRFQADGGGAIAAGTTVLIPAFAPAGYEIGVLVADNTPWFLAAQPYVLTAASPASPTPVATAVQTAPPSAALTVAPATIAPVPSSTPTAIDTAGGGIGVPIILIVILLLVILVGAFWFSRRRRDDGWPPAH